MDEPLELAGKPQIEAARDSIQRNLTQLLRCGVCVRTALELAENHAKIVLDTLKRNDFIQAFSTSVHSSSPRPELAIFARVDESRWISLSLGITVL